MQGYFVKALSMDSIMSSISAKAPRPVSPQASKPDFVGSQGHAKYLDSS